MKRKAPSCLKCNVETAQPNSKYCLQCNKAHKPGNLLLCTQCKSNPPNKGFTLCNYCFRLNNAKTTCTKCYTNQANRGYSLCEDCFKNQKSWPLCHGCSSCPPNKGYTLCQSCYMSKQNNGGKKNCVQCLITPANVGYSLCQSCFMSNQNGGNKKCVQCLKAPANVGYSLCQKCFMGSKPKCENCFFNLANPGYTLCQQCYDKSMLFCTKCKVNQPVLGKTLCKNCWVPKTIGKSFGLSLPTDSDGIMSLSFLPSSGLISGERATRFTLDLGEFPSQMRNVPPFISNPYFKPRSLEQEFKDNGMSYMYESLEQEFENAILKQELKIRGLKKEHGICLRAYSGSLYSSLNQGLIEMLWKDWEAANYWLYDAIKICKTNSSTRVLFRGFSTQITHKVGDIIVFRNWTSTTTSKAIADSFGYGGCIMHIKNWNEGIDMNWISYFPGEDEVLLSAFYQYKILNISKDGKTVELEQMPRDF